MPSLSVLAAEEDSRARTGKVRRWAAKEEQQREGGREDKGGREGERWRREERGSLEGDEEKTRVEGFLRPLLWLRARSRP